MADTVPDWKIWFLQASPRERDDWLLIVVRQIAERTGDHDLLRLADLCEAAIKGWVASKLAPNLPDKPGMASAYAISTILNGLWVQQGDGTWRSNKPLAKRGFEHDPVEAGKTWRKRLLREVRRNKENGVNDDRSDLIDLIFQWIDAHK